MLIWEYFLSFVLPFYGDLIELDVWPNCGRESITKQEVINAALSGELLSPKTSRHRLSDHLPLIAVPLSRLKLPAI